jgi:uncharacterized YigZ family protein
MTDEYRTITGEVVHEIPKIKGSRFIAALATASSVDEAEAFIAGVRARHPDARHTCFAYRIGPHGEEFRSSDDGEPSGTAGRPILVQLEGREVTDVVLAVTRYFGGVKLGAGGLVRAYSSCAAEGLRHAEIRVVRITRRVTIRYPYDLTGAVSAVIAGAATQPIESEYGASTRQVFEVPVAEVEAFVGALRDRTGGKVEIEVAT